MFYKGFHHVPPGKDYFPIILRISRICPQNDYEEAVDYYSSIGRPPIDPVRLIKVLLAGYLYGIRSERRLEEEIALNTAYRRFCGFDLMGRIPDHSTFSQNRRRRFAGSAIFRRIFNRIAGRCIESGIISGETAASDGAFIPANASWGSKVAIERIIEKSAVGYLDALDEGKRYMRRCLYMGILVTWE